MLREGKENTTYGEDLIEIWNIDRFAYRLSP